MASDLELARVREVLRATRREIRDAKARVDVTSAPVSFEAAKARQVLREAESAVQEMVALLNSRPGQGINFPLVRKIRAAEIRVTRAREALSRIDPTGIE